MSLKDRVSRNVINIPGWTTRRKIVVIESDDWGSIRMSSKQDRDQLINQGFNLSANHYNMYDSLESNEDLSALFEVLGKYKDQTNRCPVITAVSIVANPDFDRIKRDDFQHYYYEPFTDTLNRYPKHDHVTCLYNYGVDNRLFVPVFHGREHLNVQRWMRALQQRKSSVLHAFDHRVTGISLGMNGEFLGDFQAAFDVDFAEDINCHREILRSGLDLFEKLRSYKAAYFVATNGPFNNSLEKVLDEKGVKYLLTERRQIEPVGDARYKKHFRYMGMRNSYNQYYLTRNVLFEPGCVDKSLSNQSVEKCLKNIERAFRWNKPAVISSHRVNYIGFIDEKYRTANLRQLDRLLKSIVTKWPDVEFITSVELGNLISAK